MRVLVLVTIVVGSSVFSLPSAAQVDDTMFVRSPSLDVYAAARRLQAEGYQIVPLAITQAPALSSVSDQGTQIDIQVVPADGSIFSMGYPKRAAAQETADD